LARYATQFVPLTRSGPLPAAKAAAERSTARAPEHTLYALSLLRRGRAELAKQELKRALALDPKFADARFLDAQLSAHDEPVQAIAGLHRLIADGHDGYAVEMLLAQMLGSNDESGALEALKAAAKLDPTQAAPEYALADLAEKRGDSSTELAALRVLAQLEQHEPRVYQRLLRRLNEAGAFSEAVKVGEAAIYADVEGLSTHLLFAEALAHTGQRERARFELESAVLCEGTPQDMAEAHARLSDLYSSLGKRKEAKQEADKARSLDPKNPRFTGSPK
jgi:tetratricopeptide (TPR) repeat protein